MKKSILVLFLLSTSVTAMAAIPSFTVCNGKYALCTTALCTPIAGKKNAVSCGCDVKTGYSVGTMGCQDISQPNNDQVLYSRYYPIKSYAICKNNRPWAWCLDSACTIDKNDPSKASCICSTVQGKGAYVAVIDSNSYNKASCTTGIISSALVTQSEQISDFLGGQPNLKPYTITVHPE
ncbi:MAG: hypothetical protein K2Q14_03095 [Gammaproteobacteria bacterium]|nr:hypothetical protein [Gammaproteobacteria bacterium]